MSIATPFQSIDCSTCGEMLFLRNRGDFFILSLLLGVFVFLLAVYILVEGILSPLSTYLLGFCFLVGAELFFTRRIVTKNALVIRRNEKI
ncbi:MAG: hypothetical protein JNK54_04825 [Elusimicrobia bacterium]|nr:hypothetical protein [Elusimicrobiota bacterium]